MGVETIALIGLVVGVAGQGYNVNRSMHQERIAERAKKDAEADVSRREDQLSNEAKAKAAAAEKMKTAGQRAGAQYGFGGASSFFEGGGMNFMSGFRGTGTGRGSGGVEDNIGRGSLYGN